MRDKMTNEIIKNGVFTKPEWQFEKHYYVCAQNGFGHWWCTMYTTHDATKPKTSWYPVYIRDSKPFKKLNNAIKYVEFFVERDNKKGLRCVELPAG